MRRAFKQMKLDFVIDLKELESTKHFHAIVGKMDLTLGSWVLTKKSLRLPIWWLSWSWSSRRIMEPLRRKPRKCWIWWGYTLTDTISCNVIPWSSQTEVWLKRGPEVLPDSQQWSWMLWIHVKSTSPCWKQQEESPWIFFFCGSMLQSPQPLVPGMKRL